MRPIRRKSIWGRPQQPWYGEAAPECRSRKDMVDIGSIARGRGPVEQESRGESMAQAFSSEALRLGTGCGRLLLVSSLCRPISLPRQNTTVRRKRVNLRAASR
jgi:hypothetical protein